MNRRFRNILVCLCATLAVFLANIVAAHPTYAAASNADIILKKTLLNGLQTCYNDTYMKSTIAPADFMGIDSLMVTGFWSNPSDTDGVIRVPNNVGNTLNDADISCRQLFNGYQPNKSSNSIKGLFALFNRSNSASNTTQKKRLLENLGYDISEAAGGTETGCISITYQTVENSQYSSPKTTNQICMKVENGKVNVGVNYENISWDSASFTSPLYLSYDGYNNRIDVMRDGSVDPLNYIAMPVAGNDVDWTTITSRADNVVGEYNWEGDYSWQSYHFNIQKANKSLEGGETFAEAKRSSNADVRALRFFSGEQNATFTTYSFVTEDKYALYTAYLNQELQKNSSLIMGSGSECSTSLDTAKTATGYAVRNGNQWCALHGVETGGNYNIIENRLNNKLIAGTFKDVINELMGLNYDRLAEAGVEIGTLEGGEMSGGAETGPGSTNPGSNIDGDAGIFDGCISNAGVLGWIICPVTRIVGEAVKGIYTDIADNYLTMKSATMTSESLRGAWSQFQGYANILFAILLVFVILSQVTSIGLSNYGIKKVLPRLIITIVLVNLSFILCSVAVDLSNILGVRLDELFSNIDVGGVVADELNLGTLVGNTLTSLTGAATTVAVGAGIVSVVIATEAWKFMILPLLLTLLTAFIGIIFFYVILGVRQAAIVLLVAISPIAIVCYALPNTQKLFSRWVKIFADLLMVFPICGILMGGGNFASRLLLTAGGDVPFMYFLIAMLLSVVPFFFIPTILKGSMTAMGNLGMKISNMGSRLGSWSERTIRGTRAFQDHQQEALRESNMARDKGIMDRYRNSVKRLSAKEKDGTITKREQQQLNRARYRLNRASGRRERAIMEDLQASVNATREELEPGTERYNTTRDRLARRQAAEEARGLTELYDAGIASKLDGSGKLDTSDEDAVVAELDAIMSKLDTDPEDNDALAKMQALSSSMMGKGEFGENVIRSALERHVAGQMRSGRRTATENSGLRQLSNFISSGQMGGRLKADDRDTFDMATALAKGDKYYSDPDGFAKDFGVDASGNIVHNKFAHGSAGKLSARGLADSNDALLDRIEAAVSGGDISGTELNTLMKNVDEALNNDTIQLKTGVRQKLENIARQAYTKSGGTATTRAANSTSASIMANSSTNTLDAMLSRVQNYASLSTAEQAAQADELRVMAENAKYALENDIVKDTATAERLQNIVEAVRGQGISDFAGNTGGNSFKLNTGSFKIRGVQAEQHASVPTGWKQNSTAPGGYMIETTPGNYRNLNAQELEQLKEIQAFNRQVDMRNSSKGLGGSGTGSP